MERRSAVLWLVNCGLALLVGAVACGGSSVNDPNGNTGGVGGGSGGSGATGGTSGSGAIPGLTDCTANSDCVLRSASCCGQCGAPSRQDSIAINKDKFQAYGQSVCGQDVGCPACYTPKDPSLIATCDAGQCQVVDLKTHPSTACSSPNDCRLRTNVCCECGAPTGEEHLIAISSEPGFSALVCDPTQGCDECAPVYPSLSVSCEQGHCSVDTPPF